MPGPLSNFVLNRPSTQKRFRARMSWCRTGAGHGWKFPSALMSKCIRRKSEASEPLHCKLPSHTHHLRTNRPTYQNQACYTRVAVRKCSTFSAKVGCVRIRAQALEGETYNGPINFTCELQHQMCMPIASLRTATMTDRCGD